MLEFTVHASAHFSAFLGIAPGGFCRQAGLTQGEIGQAPRYYSTINISFLSENAEKSQRSGSAWILKRFLVSIWCFVNPGVSSLLAARF